jgi:hypothetical protein
MKSGVLSNFYIQWWFLNLVSKGSPLNFNHVQNYFQFYVTHGSKDPRAPWALRAKPREEKCIFGLLPLVTYQSSIPLLGGLLILMASRLGTLWNLGNLIELELSLCSIESNEEVTINIIIIAPESWCKASCCTITIYNDDHDMPNGHEEYKSH